MDAMYHSGSGRNTKWVCPNDRQLALRAKYDKRLLIFISLI